MSAVESFAQEKFAWLDQVRLDHSLIRSCLHVALAIASYVNSQSREAWPSQGRLAEECGLTRNGLRKAIKELSERGHLEVVAGQGFNNPSRYRWKLIGQRKGNPSGPLSREEGQPQWPLSSAERATTVRRKGNPSVQERATGVATNNMNEQSEEQMCAARTDVQVVDSKKSVDQKSEVDAAFDRFKTAFPRRPSPRWSPARKKFESALRRGVNAEVIIAGAEAYRDACARDGTKPQFIQQPLTWLNQEGWTVDHAPIAPAAAVPIQTAPTFPPSTWAHAVDRFSREGSWPHSFGPRPGSPGCAVPADILAKHNIGAA